MMSLPANSEVGSELQEQGVFQDLRLPPDRDGMVWLLHRGRRGLMHRHEELEINLCVAGRAEYLVENRRYALSRRTALWLFPAQGHVLLERSADFKMWIVVWKPALIERTCRHLRSAPLLLRTPGETWISRLENEDMVYLEQLCAALQPLQEDHFNAGLGWLLMECFTVWQRNAQPVAGNPVHPAIERAARLLREESLDARELASRVGLSPARLSRVFHQQIGQTLTQFRTQSAVERFLQAYDGRNCSLLEAAARAGFGSYAQFHRALRENTGLGPAQHRERLRSLH